VRAVNHARAGRRRLPSALARKRTCVLISILEGPGVIFYRVFSQRVFTHVLSILNPSSTNKAAKNWGENRSNF
jgi:hypothetical protein